jgi:hypothetical protein
LSARAEPAREEDGMHPTSLPRRAASAGDVATAVVLLAGVLVLAYGHYAHRPRALLAGLAVTLAGVFVGILRIVIQRRP